MNALTTRDRWLAPLAALALLAASAAWAQDEGASEAGMEGGASATEDIPASLTQRDLRMLREGRGMGMGRVAGLNGYPGPMHVLRQAEALELTEEQIGQTQALRTRVHERAIEIGQRIIAAEAELDDLFETRPVDRDAMNAQLQHIAGLRAELRAVHLEAHLAQADVLTAEQLEKIGEMEMGMRRGEGHGQRHRNREQRRQRMHQQRNGEG